MCVDIRPCGLPQAGDDGCIGNLRQIDYFSGKVPHQISSCKERRLVQKAIREMGWPGESGDRGSITVAAALLFILAHLMLEAVPGVDFGLELTVYRRILGKTFGRTTELYADHQPEEDNLEENDGIGPGLSEQEDAKGGPDDFDGHD